MFIYNSVNSFVNYIASVAGQRSRYEGSQDGERDFYGRQTLIEAINLFEKGYNKPLESLKKFAINCNNIYINKFVIINIITIYSELFQRFKRLVITFFK